MAEYTAYDMIKDLINKKYGRTVDMNTPAIVNPNAGRYTGMSGIGAPSVNAVKPLRSVVPLSIADVSTAPPNSRIEDIADNYANGIAGVTPEDQRFMNDYSTKYRDIGGTINNGIAPKAFYNEGVLPAEANNVLPISQGTADQFSEDTARRNEINQKQGIAATMPEVRIGSEIIPAGLNEADYQAREANINSINRITKEKPIYATFRDKSGFHSMQTGTETVPDYEKRAAVRDEQAKNVINANKAENKTVSETEWIARAAQGDPDALKVVNAIERHKRSTQRPDKADKPEYKPGQALKRISAIDSAIARLNSGNPIDTMLAIQMPELAGMIGQKDPAVIKSAVEQLKAEKAYVSQFAPEGSIATPTKKDDPLGLR